MKSPTIERVNRLEMKPQTCCCHICKTSLNQYKREFLPCTTCNKIVCKNCFGTKFKGSTWEESSKNRLKWLCPSCAGTCTCPRCRKRPVFTSLKTSNGSEEFKRESSPESSIATPSHSPARGTEREEKVKVDKLKIKVEKLVFAQLQDLIDQEKRCDTNIKEMSRLMLLMKREKEDIIEERLKLEAMINERKKKQDQQNRDGNPTNGESSGNEFGSQWNLLLYTSLCNISDQKKRSSNCEDLEDSGKEIEYFEDEAQFDDLSICK